MRVDFGLVSGGVRDSGLGISLSWFLQVPSKVPSGLTQVDAVVYFRDRGLFWAISRLFLVQGRAFWGLVLGGTLVISMAPPGS